MNGAWRGLAVLTVLALAACAARPPLQPPSGSFAAGTLSAAELLAAVQGDADRIDQSQASSVRAQLLAAATASAEQCLARFPDNAACPYAQAQVQGLTARVKPLEAPALLKQMLASLAQAESRDPTLDHAGPARLAAIVLLRAPPWPLGPGDVDAALTAAQRAVKHDPDYPPNLITLGAAQAKAVGSEAARVTYGKAQQAVQAWPAAADRVTWQQQIAQGLRDLQ